MVAKDLFFYLENYKVIAFEIITNDINCYSDLYRWLEQILSKWNNYFYNHEKAVIS